MGHTHLAIILSSVVVLAAAAALPPGPDYSKYDPQKLQQRYNIIQALVRPQTAYKRPQQIGTAYSRTGYNNAATGYNNNGGYGGYAPTSYSNQRYAPTSYPNQRYAPATGYSTGNNNQYAAAPAQYGFQGYGGIRFGGGKVHPIFNNDLLYKAKATPKGSLGPYDSTSPIFIGGGPTKPAPAAAFRASSYNAQPAYGTYNKFSPQIDAYGNRPANAGTYPFYG